MINLYFTGEVGICRRPLCPRVLCRQSLRSRSYKNDSYVAQLLGRVLMTFSIQMSLRSRRYKPSHLGRIAI